MIIVIIIDKTRDCRRYRAVTYPSLVMSDGDLRPKADEKPAPDQRRNPHGVALKK